MLGVAVAPAAALAVTPGVMDIVHEDPGGRDAPQLELLVVPVGRAGLAVILSEAVEFCPVLVTMSVLVVPPAAKASVAEFNDSDVAPGGLSAQLINIEVTLALTLVPK